MTLPGEFLDRPIAHRGLHDIRAGRAENAPAAVRAAVEAGYGIEIDLQLSADAVAIVFHDAKLGRMTGRPGRVADLAAARLGALRLAGTQETIPTLAQVLALVAGRVPLLVELKDQSERPGGGPGPLAAATAAALARYRGPVALMSFSPAIVGELARRVPDIPRGLIGMDGAKAGGGAAEPAVRDVYEAYDRVGAAFVSHRWQDLGMQAVARLKARGVPVLCWTVRSAAEEAAARRIADNVTFEGYLPA